MVWESTVRGLHNLGKHIHPSGNAGIYHARYCTSGGDHQPIYRNDRVLAFNGVIDMGTKEEMEMRHSVTMNTDNDGELFLIKTLTFKSMIEFIDNPKITFAGLIMDSISVVAIRNVGRPLWMYEDIDCRYFASTKDIFKRAGFNELYCEELEPLKPYVWPIN